MDLIWDSGYLSCSCGINIGDTIAENESLEVFRDWSVKLSWLSFYWYSIYIPLTFHRILVAIAKRLKLQKNLESFQLINRASSIHKATPCMSHNGSSMLSIQSCFCRVSEVPLQKVALALPAGMELSFSEDRWSVKTVTTLKRCHKTVGQFSIAQDLCMWLTVTPVFLCGPMATFLS
jgi:hypothetical protein